MFIDSHCHIHLPEFDQDRESVFEQAHAAAIEHFMIIGNDHESNKIGFDMLKDREDCSFALGIHPHHAMEWSLEIETWLKEHCQHPKVKAIGEAGLDYYRNQVSKVEQEKVLRSQIELALTHQIPIVLHIRDAFLDAYRILAEYPHLKFIVHCFTGTKNDVDWIIQLGGYISLSGIVTFTNAKSLQKLVPSIPNERLLWETDAPFLAPGQYRGKRCEPAFLVETAEMIATLRQTNFAVLAEQVLKNTKTIFGL